MSHISWPSPRHLPVPHPLVALMTPQIHLCCRGNAPFFFFLPTQTKPRQKGNGSLQFCSPLLFFFLSWSSHSNVLKCVTVTLYKAFKESTSTCRLFQNEIINKRKNKSGPSLKAKKTPKNNWIPSVIYLFFLKHKFGTLHLTNRINMNITSHKLADNQHKILGTVFFNQKNHAFMKKL